MVIWVMLCFKHVAKTVSDSTYIVMFRELPFYMIKSRVYNTFLLLFYDHRRSMFYGDISQIVCIGLVCVIT